MDISSLKTTRADEGAVMTLRHPETGDLLDGATITLLGTDSKVYRDHMAKRQRATLEHMQGSGQMPKLTPEQIRKNAVEDLVVLTKGWTLKVGDSLKEFSPDAARSLYDDPGFSWVTDQAEAFVKNKGNFLGK